MFGAREAAWPLIRDDLSLSYAEVGVLLALPSVASLAVEPLLGLVAVTWRRRALVLGGGLAFAGALALAAVARSEWMLLAAFAVLYPASGAFVSLSQASLMDLDPERREHNMARWTVAGSIGAIAGPLLLAAAAWAGLGWRGLFAAFAVLTLGLLLRPGPAGAADGERLHVREALRAITRREVLRWLLLLELADLLLDVFVGFLALYLADEAGASRAAAGLAVAVWAGAGLAGLGGDDPAAATDRRPALPARQRDRGRDAVRRVPRRARHRREARGARGARGRERRLVPGAPGAPLRRARRSERPGADGEHARPAVGGAPRRDRGRRGPLGPRRSAVAAARRAGRAARSRCPEGVPT